MLKKMLAEMEMVILLEWGGGDRQEGKSEKMTSSFEFESEAKGVREIEFNH